MARPALKVARADTVPDQEVQAATEGTEPLMLLHRRPAQGVQVPHRRPRLVQLAQQASHAQVLKVICHLLQARQVGVWLSAGPRACSRAFALLLACAPTTCRDMEECVLPDF